MDKARIMVAVDFGSTSERALDKAIDLARRLDVSLDIVNIGPHVPIEAQEAAAMPPNVEAAWEELGKLRARAEAAGVEARAHLRHETVVFGLLEAIDELDPELVVVGSHGRRGVARMLMGSVSESLARRCSVPIVIVPAPERAALATAAAWSCKACGYILADGESAESCPSCGEFPARWLTALVGSEPADAGEPTVGEGAGVDAGVALPDVQDGPSLFATSPAGSFDRTEPNAEIRIRRF
jgi:universal stress protein A